MIKIFLIIKDINVIFYFKLTLSQLVSLIMLEF